MVEVDFVVLVVDVAVVVAKDVSNPVVLDSIVDVSDVVELTPVTELETSVEEELAASLSVAAKLDVVVIMLVVDIVVVEVSVTGMRFGMTDWQSLND